MMTHSALTFGGTGANPSRWRRLPGMAIGLVYLCLSGAGHRHRAGDRREGRRGASLGLVAFIACYIAVVMSQRTFGEPNRLSYLLMLVVTAAGHRPARFCSAAAGSALPIYIDGRSTAWRCRTRWAVSGIVAHGRRRRADRPAEAERPGHHLGAASSRSLTLGMLFMSVRNTRLLVTQLRQAQDEVARLAASEERLRIARDLHDLLGHSLSLIVLKSELAGRLAEQRLGTGGGGDQRHRVGGPAGAGGGTRGRHRLPAARPVATSWTAPAPRWRRRGRG